MKVYLEYFAQLRDVAGRASEEYQTTSPTVAALYDELKGRYDFPFEQRQLRVAINDTFVAWEHMLEEGASVVFIPPVTGG